MAKTNLKEMPVEVRSSGKEPQNDFFAAFLEYVKQHADEAIAAVEAQCRKVNQERERKYHHGRKEETH